MRTILRAWKEPEPFGWQGRHFHYRTVSVWPKPLQQPLPPMKLSPPAPRPPGISRPNFVLLAAAAVRFTHETCTQVRFAMDSAVEGDGFEPSVPG